MFGWSVVPEVNLTKHLVFKATSSASTSVLSTPARPGLLLLRVRDYNFAPRSKFTPFVFAEGGEMRLSRQRTLAKDWNPVVKGGFGLEHRVSDRFALTLVPGEYLGQYQDDGSWNHSFTARAGLTFNLLGHRSSM